MSDGMGREFMYLSSHATNRYFIPNWGMYIANFSEPYKGMIRCDILPKDKMVGIYGSPVISAFLFKYNNRGEIYQSYKAEVNID